MLLTVITLPIKWNDTARGKPKSSEKSLLQPHFNNNQSNTDSAGTQTGTSLRDANDQPPQPWQGLLTRSTLYPKGRQDVPVAHNQQTTITIVW